MRRSLQETLLREYVRSILSEEDGDGGNPAAGGAGDIGLGAGSPYGISFGSGDDLVSTFITPFTDVFKTALGQTKEITKRARTVLWVGLQTLLTTLIPIYGYDYADVFDKEKDDIKKIREKYADVYDRTDKALASSDAALLAFMACPAAVIGAKGAAATPKAAKGLLSVMTGGLSDEVLAKVQTDAAKAGRTVLGDDENVSSPSKSNSGPRGRFEGQLREVDDEKPTLDKILRNKKFLDKVLSSPKAQEMQRAAQEVYKRTLQETYNNAETLLKKMNTVEELEKQAKGKIKGDMKAKVDEVKKLPPGEKKKAEAMLVSGVRKAMKDFYVKNLTDHVRKVIEAGVPADAQYVKDYKTTIQKIKSL